MAEKEIVKEYSEGGITVVWKPQKCIHSGVCVKTLPEVYHPESRPWIQPEKATIKDLKAQIDLCPSGALSYKLKGEQPESGADPASGTRVEVIAKGPLMVHGMLEVRLADGSIEQKKRSTAFCRCGSSGNKPYCDGSHKKSGFEG